MQGTSIKLANGEVLRSYPNYKYEVQGYGKCAAEEVLPGDFIKVGKRFEKVDVPFTWRVQGRRQEC
jgi:hypothetical protein